MPTLTQDFFHFEPPQSGRFSAFALIFVVHAVLFIALRNGLLPQAAHALPQQVLSVFIASEPAHASPQPRMHPPKLKLAEPPPVADSVALPLPAVPVSTAPVPETASAPAAIAIPPAAPAPLLPRVISSGVEYIHPPRPDYPPLARRLGEEGRVLLRILINEKGRPEQVEIEKSSGFPRLDEAARQAAFHALFKPHIEDGRPIAVYAIVPIGFKLS